MRPTGTRTRHERKRTGHGVSRWRLSSPARRRHRPHRRHRPWLCRLPVATHMSRHFPVVGFDVNGARITELERGIDRTREVSPNEFRNAKSLAFSADGEALRACNFFIVTVPTPIDAAKRPDLTSLERASATVGKVLKRGDVVVYESTVYPGATEEVCVPILEAQSGCASMSISRQVTRRSGSIPVTRSTGFPTLSRSPRVPIRKRPASLTPFMVVR